MAERRFQELPLDQIIVVNSRFRDEQQFQMNVQSIENSGLLMPVRVNDKFLSRTGKYELICGEGRLLAHKKLDRKVIRAEVVTCSRKDAYLESLIENIARTKPGTMDYAHELKRLKDEGWEYEKIARVACKCAEYIRNLVRLVEQGEDRLIRGVESGVFSMAFAMQVAYTDNANVQHVLMDAFDEGLVHTGNFAQARRIIAARLHRNGKAVNKDDLTVAKLKKDIAEATKARNSYVREAEAKESRFLTLLTGINVLWQDEVLRKLLDEEKIVNRPELVGKYAYEP